MGSLNGSLWSKHVADSVFYCIFTIFERTGDLNSTRRADLSHAVSRGVTFSNGRFYSDPDTVCRWQHGYGSS